MSYLRRSIRNSFRLGRTQVGKDGGAYGDPLTAYMVGLAFASNQASMVSYMTPFDLLVKDIKLVTGQRMVEPAWAREAPGTTLKSLG